MAVSELLFPDDKVGRMCMFCRRHAVNPVQEHKSWVVEWIDSGALYGNHKCCAGSPGVREKHLWEVL
jgi:hypothetical protein